MQVLSEYVEVDSGKKVDREKLIEAVAHAKKTKAIFACRKT